MDRNHSDRVVLTALTGLQAMRLRYLKPAGAGDWKIARGEASAEPQVSEPGTE
jgi:hypothetical protein